MILQMVIFFFFCSEFFKDNVSKTYVQIFQKRKNVQKIMYKEIFFNDYFFKMHMYEEFERSQEYVETSK